MTQLKCEMFEPGDFVRYQEQVYTVVNIRAKVQGDREGAWEGDHHRIDAIGNGEQWTFRPSEVQVACSHVDQVTDLACERWSAIGHDLCMDHIGALGI